ncbi:MAG: preprotein translocase subunit SecA [Micavibrio aeruginosavorus]|uniref:Protein translocase subunit SecA n=1 Tax=Micavibrio aeruginosavorus TaxID=349221 RepID=A0A2W5A8R4_9BACT|nr:MAG: preprotein translocase subunit SecA [Micavibrio aeruginosavorus]
MLLNLALKLFGSSNERSLRRLQAKVGPINALEPEFEALSDAQLQGKTAEFKARIEKGESLDALLPEAFATVREAAKRVLGMRPFDVQLIGGMVLHDGKIAEMRTGEGKTLMATMPVYLNAIAGKGVHVVTVNDYLAKRDSAWMGQIYNFLGLSYGVITANLSDQERQDAYNADITYGTNNEFGFDYLRDNMKFRLDQMVQRPFNFAIVDEVDSILIDEARTPLIISGPSEGDTSMYNRVNEIISKLTPEDYEIDEKSRAVSLTENGNEHAEQLLRDYGIMEGGNMYDAANITLVHHVNQALRAHKIFNRDTDYIVKDGKVIIIDEFTGRMMEGRRYSEGLHQALEAKEGVQIQKENQTLASITFQNYFRMYPKLGGMTGTALTEAAEFAEIYNLGVIDIPTNVPVARRDHDDKIYKSIPDKYEAIVELIHECAERGQPVLVGTVSIEKSEMLSDLLKRKKVQHSVLNARYHEQEAQIVSQAGRPGAVTIATNMAGRGTDIKLGGNADMLIEQAITAEMSDEEKTHIANSIRADVERDQKIVKEAGGLFVIGTERHESRRIDNQLRGRSGRQGDPGASVFFLSVEDDLMRIFASDKMEALLKSQIGLKDGEALTHPWLSKALERAQARVEQQNFEIRKNLLKFDNVMNDQRKVIYDQRREIMDAGEELDEVISEMRLDVIEDMVNRTCPAGMYPEQWDVDALHGDLQRLLNLNLPVADWAKEEDIDQDTLRQRIEDIATETLEKKLTIAGRDTFRRMSKNFLLQLLDQHWKEHLLALDHLRQGINLRAFGQRDPLNEYKAEAFSLFEVMMNNLREAVTQTISFVEISASPEVLAAIQRQQQQAEIEAQKNIQETRLDPAMEAAAEEQRRADNRANVMQIRKVAFDQNDPSTWVNTQRNAPCPCGSGKKYKHCHGAV